LLLEHIEDDCIRSGAILVPVRGSDDFRKISFEYGDLTSKGLEVIGETKKGQRKIYGRITIGEVFSDNNLKRILDDEYLRKLFRL